jgi:hypothetical protein
MSGTWVVYAFISYLALALLVPTIWALWPAWRRARIPRHVTCPGVNATTVITLDRCYAVRMHALGNNEGRVKNCERWPQRQDCRQECLAQIGTTV